MSSLKLVPICLPMSGFLVRLMTVLALLAMPVAMAGASAQVPGHSAAGEHCDGEDESVPMTQPISDCVSCAGLLPDPGLVAGETPAMFLVLSTREPAFTGIVPEIATPPPRIAGA